MGTFPAQPTTKHQRTDLPPPPPPSPTQIHLSLLPLLSLTPPASTSSFGSWSLALLSAFSIYCFLYPGTCCCRNPIAYLKSLCPSPPAAPPGTSGVSSPGKHIVPTLKVCSLKSSSCIFIRMKYRTLRSVQGFINDVLSGAGCSAYLHIKQLSEETFFLLLQGINQFKASSHHLYSFQLSLLLLK